VGATGFEPVPRRKINANLIYASKSKSFQQKSKKEAPKFTVIQGRHALKLNLTLTLAEILENIIEDFISNGRLYDICVVRSLTSTSYIVQKIIQSAEHLAFIGRA
jgi:hypothetical protein